MTASKRSQTQHFKHSRKTTNWPKYEAGLRQRGSLMVWISEDELKGWGPAKKRRQRKPGGQEMCRYKTLIGPTMRNRML